jgi:hypothetical protein
MPDNMMNDFDRGLIRIAKIIVGLILLAAFLLAVGAWISPPPAPRVAPLFTDTDRRYVTTRLKYHGITSAEMDETTGERYFYRDGKRCRL